MKISSRSKYGLRAMIYLAKQGKICSIKEIAEAEKISEDYLEKICSKLKKAGLLKVKKGISGGFYLAKRAEQINLAQIIGALEKNYQPASCVTTHLQQHQESRISCPRARVCSAKNVWQKI